MCAVKRNYSQANTDVHDLFSSMKPVQMSTWEKMWELQIKMLFFQPDSNLQHMFSSTPTEWPFLARNVAYWINSTTNVCPLFHFEFFFHQL